MTGRDITELSSHCISSACHRRRNAERSQRAQARFCERQKGRTCAASLPATHLWQQEDTYYEMPAKGLEVNNDIARPLSKSICKVKMGCIRRARPGSSRRSQRSWAAAWRC